MHGNLLHLAMNMFALWQAGQLVERIFGSARFAGLYLLAGIGGSVGSLAWSLLSHHPVNSVGAFSRAIAWSRKQCPSSSSSFAR